MDWIERLTVLGLAPLDGRDFSPLSDEEVSDIEHAVGARLPDDYRLFLTRFGPSLFEKDILFPTRAGGCIPGWFLGRDIKKLMDNCGDRYPTGVVPINDDGGNNMIVMSLRGESYGAIYYQSHSAGIGEPPKGREERDAALLGTLFWLAPNFASFMCGLELGTH